MKLWESAACNSGVLSWLQDPHVESYAMKDVERTLCMDREKLVALGLLLGCDFVPQGVPGVGRETALKFMAELRGCSVLDRSVCSLRL